MYLLLLVVLVCSLLNICKSSDEEKYIDLLPEEEKQAFLEQVARRLVNGVTTKDSRYKSSEEISDDELNRHSAYVKQVLEEESGNIRRNVDRKERNENHNELEVKGIKKPSVVDDVEDVNHIDLTLRGGNRRKRDKDDDYKTISVDTVYDNENDKKFKKFAEKNNAEEKAAEGKELTGENTTAEDIQVRGNRKSRKVNESPDVEKNVISNEATQAVDDDAEDTTESNQNDTEEDEAPTESDLKSNQKGYTVPIYDAEDENHEYDANEPVTDVTTTTIEETPTTQDTTTQKSTTTKSTTTKSTTDKTTKVKTTTTKTTTPKTTPAKNNATQPANGDKAKVYKKRYLRANDGEVDKDSTTTIEKNLNDSLETSTNSDHITTKSVNDDVVASDYNIQEDLSKNTNLPSNNEDESKNESTSTFDKISVTTETLTSTFNEENLANSVVNTNKQVFENKEVTFRPQTPRIINDSDDENISTTSFPDTTVDNSDVKKHLSNENNSVDIKIYEEIKEESDKYAEEKTKKRELQDNTESLTLVSQNADKTNFEFTNTSTAAHKETGLNNTDVGQQTTYKTISETVDNHEEEATTVSKQIESRDVSLNIARTGNSESHSETDVKVVEPSKTNTFQSVDKVENSAVSNKPDHSENYESDKNVYDKREATHDYNFVNKRDIEVTESYLYNSVSFVNSNNTKNEEGITAKTIQFINYKAEENVTRTETESLENNKSSTYIKFVDTIAKPVEDYSKANYKPVKIDKEFQSQSTSSQQNADSTTNIENESNVKDLSNSTNEEKENPILNNTLRSDERKQYVLTTTERNSVLTATPNSVTYKIYYSQNDSQNENGNNYSKTIDDLTPNNLESKSNSVATNPNSDDNELADFVSQSLSLRNILKAIGGTVKSKSNQNILQKNDPADNSSQKKLKEYIVYEIPEGETPFLRKEKENNQEKGQVKIVKENEQEEEENKNQDQPYYVPIYNYAPNNAYYNPHNRLGPNVDDNQNDESVQIVREIGRDLGNSEEIASSSFEMDPKDGAKIDYESLRKFKFSGKKLSSGDLNNVAKMKTQINLPLPIVVKKPKFTEIYFNPDEYLDLDYYFGRANKQPTLRSEKVINVPASFEDMHPYNLISSHKAKDHLSAIRQMLFEHGHFGYVTSSHMNNNSTEVEKDHQSNDKNIDKHHRKKKLRYKKPRYRTINDSDLIFLYPNQNLRNKLNSYTDQQDISVDYYFGVDDNVAKKRENLENVNQNIRTGKETLMENNEVANIKELTKRRLKYPILYNYADYTSSEEKRENNTSFWQTNSDVIKKLLDMSDATDVLKTFEKLHDLSTQNNTNKHHVRTKSDDDEINIYLNVLKDMIEMNNKALHQFDWLGSTVDVLAALNKLRSLTNDVSKGISIHPSDLQLLKYVLHVYKSAEIALEESKNGLREEIDKKKRKYALPRNQKKPKEYLTAKGLINRIWLYIRGRDKEESLHEINDFGVFLDDLGSSLYDLYDALKHIALVTKYKKQKWYDNLKEIYLKNTQKRYLLEVLVHVFTTRLVGLIEDSAINGLEDGYLQYVKNNTKIVERTVDEFVFVLKFLSAFKDANIQNL